MTVNLLDNTFRHDLCSTFGKVPERLCYVRDLREWDGVTLFVDGFTTDAEAPARDGVRSSVRLGWLHEPPCLIPTVYAAAADNLRHFDAVLTYDAALLALPGFRFMPYGGIWIEPENWGLWPKNRLCSMLLGAKMATVGHRIRHTIADAVEGMGVDFFGVRGTPVSYGPAAKVQVLGEYAFSIVGEACRVDNLFTEILLDCFAVGTVPVFWGCPNLSQYFDERGVLSFETPAECAELVRGLSFRQYDALRPYAAENQKRAIEYAIADDWMYDHILHAYEN